MTAPNWKCKECGGLLEISGYRTFHLDMECPDCGRTPVVPKRCASAFDPSNLTA